MRALAWIGALTMCGCVTSPPVPDGWQVMPEGSSLRGDCEENGFAVVDHEGVVRIAATLGEIIGDTNFIGGSPRPQGEGWLLIVPGGRGPNRTYESNVSGQALEHIGTTVAVAAIVDGNGRLLARNDCRNRSGESSIIRVEDGSPSTPVAGPWPICVRAIARDADDRIWLLADLQLHWEVELYNVLFRLDESGRVLHYEYILDPHPDFGEEVGTGGLSHMEIVDGMVWLSGLALPVIRLRQTGGRWVEERIVPNDCRIR